MSKSSIFFLSSPIVDLQIPKRTFTPKVGFTYELVWLKIRLTILKVFTITIMTFLSFHTGASLGIWIDEFDVFERRKLPSFSVLLYQNVNFYWIFSKIDGFKNPSLKIDGFNQTYANGAKAFLNDWKEVHYIYKSMFYWVSVTCFSITKEAFFLKINSAWHCSFRKKTSRGKQQSISK